MGPVSSPCVSEELVKSMKSTNQSFSNILAIYENQKQVQISFFNGKDVGHKSHFWKNTIENCLADNTLIFKNNYGNSFIRKTPTRLICITSLNISKVENNVLISKQEILPCRQLSSYCSFWFPITRKQLKLRSQQLKVCLELESELSVETLYQRIWVA